MTLIERLAQLDRPKNRDRILVAMYYASDAEGADELTTAEIGRLLNQARVPRSSKINVSDVLNKANHLVDIKAQATGPRRWALTAPGRDEAKRLLGSKGSAETSIDAGTLRGLVVNLGDDLVRDYVEESVVCLEAGAFRASIVFLWTGAIRYLQEEALSRFGAKAVTAAIHVHQPAARPVRKVDDFAAVKDKFALLGFRELGLVDKSQWQTLEDSLGLRNRCGHPGKFKPREKRTSAFIEDVLGTAFAADRWRRVKPVSSGSSRTHDLLTGSAAISGPQSTPTPSGRRPMSPARTTVRNS